MDAIQSADGGVSLRSGLSECVSNGSGKGCTAVTIYCSLLLLGLSELKHPIRVKLELNAWCSALLHPAGL